MKEKIEEQTIAQKLRMQGLSIGEIAKELNVAKSSVSGWVRNIEITLEQKQRLMHRTISPNAAKGNKARSLKCKELRQQYQLNGKILAEKMNNNMLFHNGCMLYWCEGAKCRNGAKLSNSDPYILKLWMRFLQEIFSINNNDITVYIQCYLNNGITQDEIEQYWLDVLKLPINCLRKTSLVTKHPMSKGLKKNKHKYGICNITVNSTELVQTIFGAIQYIGDFDNSEWLD